MKFTPLTGRGGTGRCHGFGRLALLVSASVALASSAYAQSEPCSSAAGINAAAQSSMDQEKIVLDSAQDSLIQAQANAKQCMQRMKDFMAAVTIRTIDLNSLFLKQLLDNAANKACNIALNKLGEVTKPIGDLNGKIDQTAGGINGAGGGVIVTTGGVTAGKVIPNMPVKTSPLSAPLSIPSPAPVQSTWDRFSCVTGNCGK